MGYQSKKKKQFVSFADGGSIELPSYERNKNWFLENKFVILTFLLLHLLCVQLIGSEEYILLATRLF